MKSSSLQFQIEKRTRNVFQLHEVYKACCFKPHLRKNPVAKTSKELVCFFCRSARFAVLQLLFSGSVEVAAGLSNLRRPWGSASWALYRASIGCTVERKLYGGRGLGLAGCPHVAAEVLQMGGFTAGK